MAVKRYCGTLLLLPLLARAQSGAWEQCGGVNWTGSTTCISGYHCQYYNDFYSQCIPGSATTTAATTTAATSATGSVPSSAGLDVLAKAKGKQYFGTAVENSEFSDPPYKALLSSKEFGQVTPANAMKWDATEASRGVFTYSRANEIVSFAQANGQVIRGHTLVWHSQLPSWVSNGGFNNATLVSILQNHVTKVMTQFKGKIFHWDVVNEVFNEDGTFRTSVFYTTIGEYFIDIAFRTARATDPNAKLYINDYNIDGTGAKSTAMYNLVQRLKARGTPVDGIGVQAHLIVGSVPTTLQTNWASFASLGVDVAITELDIRMTLPSDSTKLAQQATDYGNVIKACVNIPRCVGITMWGASDGHTWVPGVFPGEGDPLPWDKNLNKKPAYTAIANALA